MLSWNAARVGSFLLAVFFLSSLTSMAQRLTENEEQFWKDYIRMKQTAEDEKRVDRFLRRTRTEANVVFDELVLRTIEGRTSQEDREYLPDFAEALSRISKSEQYTYRYAYVDGLDGEQKTQWLAVYNGFNKAWDTYNKGVENDNPYILDDAAKLFKEAFEGFGELKDYYYQVDVAWRFGKCQEALKDPYMASVWYYRSLEAMKKLPFVHLQEAQVQGLLDGYTRKGYDPTKPRNEGGEPDPNAVPAGGETGGGEAETQGGGDKFKHPVFQTVGEPKTWSLKFQAMRSPYDFVTPTLSSAHNPYLWANVWFNSVDAETAAFNPYYVNQYFYFNFFGRPVNWVWEKNKFYLDIDGEKKTRSEIKASTRPTKLSLKGKIKEDADQEAEYDLFLQAMGEQEVMFGLSLNNAVTDIRQINLRCRTGCYTKGKALDDNVILIDDNTSGTYGDYFTSEGDTITYGSHSYWRTDAVVVGREKTARPYSKYLLVGDKWYSMETDPTGENLTTQEVSVDTGTLRLDWEGDGEPSYLVLHLLTMDTPDFFINVAGSSDPVVLPVGEYEIAWGKIEDPKKGQAKMVAIYKGNAPYLRVFAGEETVLSLGAPFTFTFETETFSGNYIVKGNTVNVWGRGGELYGIFFDDLPQPIVSIRHKESGKIVEKGEKMRLPAVEDTYTNRNAIWYPLDFIYENKGGDELEAQLEAKKIKNLGGPVTSEWH